MADVLRDPKPQAIHHPALRSLFDYWSGRRNGACLPARRDIDPLDIPELLPHLMLIDVEPSAELRFRLVGTALVRHLGRDTTGLAVSEGYFGTEWEKIQEDYRYVIAKRRPCLRHNQGVGRDRRTFDYQRLLLPLAADGAEVDMILAAAFWLEDAWSRA
jgi:hypothetical protein